MNAFFGFERGWQAHRPECWLQRDSKCKSKTQQKVSKFPWHKTKVLSYNFGGKSSWLNYAMSWQQCVITSEEIHFKPFLLSLLLTECYKQWKPFSGRLRKEERRNQTFPFLSKLLSPVLNRPQVMVLFQETTCMLLYLSTCFRTMLMPKYLSK